MPFSFEIDKPRDIKSALISAKQKIMGGGGMFSGDEHSGRFSGRGVNGLYEAGDSSIKITILKKPAIYSVPSVKSAIENYFRE